MASIDTPAPPRLSFLARPGAGAFRRVGAGLWTLLCVGVLLALIGVSLKWAVIDATVSADARERECAASGGACWSVITNRWRLILFGLYPFEQHWRSALACVVILATVALSCLPQVWKATRLSALWVLGFLSFYGLMKGGVFGLVQVPEQQWGGLSLTLFIFATTVLIGFPLAIMLALLRNSSLPWISGATGLVIDTIRSLPMLSILFMFAIVLPFMLPSILIGEKLYRVIASFALYFAAYQAEIIRGGLQSIPKGQSEAAQALGLRYRYRMLHVLLPQAMRSALPATINQIVVCFMETSLVVIVGFFDVLASGNAAYRTAEWTFAFVEVYVFVGGIYFLFSFLLSSYGAYLERRLNQGRP